MISSPEHFKGIRCDLNGCIGLRQATCHLRHHVSTVIRAANIPGSKHVEPLRPNFGLRNSSAELRLLRCLDHNCCACGATRLRSSDDAEMAQSPQRAMATGERREALHECEPS